MAARLRFRGGGHRPGTGVVYRTLSRRCRWTANCGSARDQFDALSGTVRKLEPVDAEWRQVRYLVFELPGAAGDFSERVRQMQTTRRRRLACPGCRPSSRRAWPTMPTLMQQLDAVVRAGGEGLMLHRADAPYLTGRSDALLKLKPWQDAEAVVVGHAPGKGKYQGMTGALEMEMPDGQRFRIGSGLSDALRRQPPPIGTRITYRYQHLTKNGMPRFPRYLRVREDF